MMKYTVLVKTLTRVFRVLRTGYDGIQKPAPEA